MRLIITGGGTGGHVFAGIAIAQEFLSQSAANKVLFIGSDIGLETKLVPKAGYELKTVSVGKLVGQNPLRKMLTVLQIPIAVFRCLRWMKEFDADLVIGVGGFASGPCMIAAKILRLPSAVLEQNTVMGFTNKVSAKLADLVFLAFDSIPSSIPAQKCVFTGNPSRSSLAPVNLKTSKPFTIFIFGGSQGAHGINKMMLEAAKNLLSQKSEIEIIHQTGPKDYQWVKDAYEEIQYPAKVHVFIDDMQAIYAAASLVICRAGSSTIAELGATGNAAILIPLPTAAQNHQEYNARLVEKAGGGLVLSQGESHGVELSSMILDLKANPGKLQTMRSAIKSFHRPNAARQIVDVLKTRALLDPRQ